MNFINLDYWPGLLALFIVFAAAVVLIEKRFFQMVKTYWFYNRSVLSYLSTFLFLGGMGLLLLSLLDARGPEEKIKTALPSHKTIILIDTSASMLAEDVKPSRLQKAALLAKHYARKAPGQQVSIVAFAEVQKKIVPFTSDLDLIDSRLDSIKSLRNQYGSSALTVALQESVQYFKETGETIGNILVLTDGEETAERINLKIPKEIHVAFVGIGTAQGGRIPLDDSRGFRFGYKKHKGQDIITKLNESFFKRIADDLPSAKYWLANSYNLPTEEIISFFNSEKVKSEGSQDMIIRPVKMELLVIPALVLLILSYFFKALKVFSLGLLLIVLPLRAQEETQPQLTPEILQKIELLQNNELSQLEKLKLADELHKGGAKKEAISLYEENLPLDKIDSKLPPEAYTNYGTALLEQGEAEKGLVVYQKISEAMKNKGDKGKEILDLIDKNVVSYFKKQEEKKKQEKEKKEKEDKENKENKDNKDQGKDQNQGQGQGQGQQKNQSSGQSGQDKKEQGKEGQNKDQKDSEGKEKDKNKGDKPEDGEDEENQKGKDNQADSESEKGKESKKLPPRKMTAKLKQLMSDDRQLQIQMIENGTRDLNKRHARESKDW